MKVLVLCAVSAGVAVVVNALPAPTPTHTSPSHSVTVFIDPPPGHTMGGEPHPPRYTNLEGPEELHGILCPPSWGPGQPHIPCVPPAGLEAQAKPLTIPNDLEFPRHHRLARPTSAETVTRTKLAERATDAEPSEIPVPGSQIVDAEVVNQTPSSKARHHLVGLRTEVEELRRIAIPASSEKDDEAEDPSPPMPFSPGRVMPNRNQLANTKPGGIDSRQDTTPEALRRLAIHTPPNAPPDLEASDPSPPMPFSPGKPMAPAPHADIEELRRFPLPSSASSDLESSDPSPPSPFSPNNNNPVQPRGEAFINPAVQIIDVDFTADLERRAMVTVTRTVSASTSTSTVTTTTTAISRDPHHHDHGSHASYPRCTKTATAMSFRGMHLFPTATTTYTSTVTAFKQVRCYGCRLEHKTVAFGIGPLFGKEGVSATVTEPVTTRWETVCEAPL